MVCGATDIDPGTFIDDGDALDVEAGCAPGADVQAMLVSRNGVDNAAPNAAAWQAYVADGGVIITELGNSEDIYNALFDTQVGPGNFNGSCEDNINPTVRLNLDDPFWQVNGALAGQGPANGCGQDMSGWGEPIVALGGWTAETISLAYRELGVGRVWLVESDWQDGDPLFSEESRQLMRAMIFDGDAP